MSFIRKLQTSTKLSIDLRAQKVDIRPFRRFSKGDFLGFSPRYACHSPLEVYPKIKFFNFQTYVEGLYVLIMSRFVYELSGCGFESRCSHLYVEGFYSMIANFFKHSTNSTYKWMIAFMVYAEVS